MNHEPISLVERSLNRLALHHLTGKRVEIAPHTDRWMRGDRYGDITAVSRTHVHVRFDKSGQTQRCPLGRFDDQFTIV